MGMDDVKLSRACAAAISPAQLAWGLEQRAHAGRELVQLDLDALQEAQRPDLIADESAPLGMVRIGEHVREDERAHDPGP